MSVLKSSTSIVNAQIIVNSLKQFEKKLDKLQDDVNYHGKTLKDLRSLVFGLSAGTIANPDSKIKEYKRERNALRNRVTKATAIQYDHGLSNKDIGPKLGRKRAAQPLPLKTQARIFQRQELTKPRCNPFSMGGKNSCPRIVPTKHSHKNHMRPSKAEAPRKATSLRTQKVPEKSRSNNIYD